MLRIATGHDLVPRGVAGGCFASAKIHLKFFVEQKGALLTLKPLNRIISHSACAHCLRLLRTCQVPLRADGAAIAAGRPFLPEQLLGGAPSIVAPRTRPPARRARTYVTLHPAETVVVNAANDGIARRLVSGAVALTLSVEEGG